MKRIILDTNLYYYLQQDNSYLKRFENYLQANKLEHAANSVAIFELINASEVDQNLQKRIWARQALKYIYEKASFPFPSIPDLIKITIYKYGNKKIFPYFPASDFKKDIELYLQGTDKQSKDVAQNAKYIISGANVFINQLKKGAIEGKTILEQQQKKLKNIFNNPEFRKIIYSTLLIDFFGIDKTQIEQIEKSCNILLSPTISILSAYYCYLITNYIQKTKLDPNDREDLLLLGYWEHVSQIITADKKFYNGIQTAIKNYILPHIPSFNNKLSCNFLC